MSTPSFAHYAGNGLNRQFVVPFPYLAQAHVKVYVSGTSVTFAWLGVGLVETTVAPASGAPVTVRRETPADAPLVDYANGNVVLDSDLDVATLQALYVAQEAIDLVGEGFSQASDGGWDANGRRIANVANPVNATDAANRQWVLAQTTTPGPVGPVGPQGIVGPIGPTGPAGPLGPTGVQGPQGPVGPTGPQGPEGPQGLQGVQGPQGIQGNSFNPDVVAASSLRSTYNAQPQGFSFLAIDLGAISFKASNTSGDWSAWVPFGVGPQGPVGTTGPQGIQGVQGIQGPAGPTGPKGLNFRGGYSAGITFLTDDVVRDQNSSWVARVNTTGNPPPTLPTIENAQWSLLASAGGAASGVTFTPAGSLASTNVQAAIEEVVIDTTTLLAGKLDVSAKAADAELLDGQDGSFYVNAANFNAGTLPDARNRTPLTIGGEAVTNWNTVSHNGWYRSNRGIDGVTNTPDGASGTRYWLGTAMNFGTGDAWRRQILWALEQTGTATETWTRIAQPGVGWLAWERMRTTQAELNALFAGLAATNIFTSSQRVGGSGVGHTVQVPGGASNAGFIGFHMPDGTRRGYLGSSSGGIVNIGSDGWKYRFDATPDVNGSDILHAGNVGANAATRHTTTAIGALFYGAPFPSALSTNYHVRGTQIAGSNLRMGQGTATTSNVFVDHTTNANPALTGTWQALGQFYNETSNYCQCTVWVRIA